MLYFFVGLVLVNLFIYYNSYIFVFLLFADLYTLGKRVHINLYLFSCIFIVLFYSLNINYYNHDIRSLDFNGVLNVLEKHDSYSIVADNDNKYFIYNNDNDFEVGNKVLFNGVFVDISNSNNSFYSYLNKNKIFYKLDYNKCEIVDSNVKLNKRIVAELLDGKSEVSKSYLKLILFNVKDENNKEFYNSFSLYSLTYLIAVSGFHINLLLSFFRKIFKNNVIGSSIVSFYLYLLDFSISSYRAFLCYIFKGLKKKLDFDISNVDVIALIGIVFVFVDPCVMFSLSFVYSFLATIVLEIFKLYKNKKIITMFYVYLVNVPLLMINYYKLNLSSILFGIILNVPISFLYIFSFLFLFFDKFYLLYEVVVVFFNKIFVVLNKLNCILIFGKPSLVVVIIYYLLLLLFFIFKENKSKTRYVMFFLLVSLCAYQYVKPIMFQKEQVYFLNVGQGDCSVLFVPHSKSVVLIDTGGNRYKDIAISEIIPFLESKGINKVSKIVLTHDDLDHAGSLESLKSNFDVGEVIDTSLVESVLIGDKTFINLNVNDKRDNDGSIVLYGEYAGYNLLFMGDASIKIESQLQGYINKVDIIKIGHHGSNTSSSYEFLKNINGRIAIISVGNNNYGHPNEEVIDRLLELKYIILRTDVNGDIGFGKNIFGLGFVDYFN